MPVLIYRDYVHDNSLLRHALCDHYGEARVQSCDADDILSGALDKNVKLFVMPGGADLYYCEKLNGAGNTAIRQWVEQGGTYLGICAGAYYACASIDWACGTKQEISGKRELAFFPGVAAGPVYDFIEGKGVNKSWLAAPALRWEDGETIHTSNVCYEAGPIFNPVLPLPSSGGGVRGGGPAFSSSEKQACPPPRPPSLKKEGGDVIVLARYAGLPNAPPAIVECAVEKGRAILCSPHLERTPDLLRKSLYKNNNSSYEWDNDVLKKLEKSGEDASTMRTLLFNRAMNRE